MAKLLIISDSKPGHSNQSLGLAEALVRCDASVEYEIQPPLHWFAALLLLFKGLLVRHDNPTVPDIIIGAGHKTHFTLWMLGAYYRAKTVVLMKPSWPLCFFDLCIIPIHDSPRERNNVVKTQGVLNRITPAVKRKNTGLILLGGPSTHFHWDGDALLSQLKVLVSLPEMAGVQWVVATSRRTPSEFVTLINESSLPVTLVEHQHTDAHWLAEKLATTEICWVTEDSVSMIYEALTAQCQVGILTLEASRESRVVKGVKSLHENGYVQQLAGAKIVKKTGTVYNSLNPNSLSEAKRCADIILQKGWL